MRSFANNAFRNCKIAHALCVKWMFNLGLLTNNNLNKHKNQGNMYYIHAISYYNALVFETTTKQLVAPESSGFLLIAYA